MAALLAELDYAGGKFMLPCIKLSTFGPFYDQTRLNQVLRITPSTISSMDFLSQRDMSPEELRLADYEVGDGILRMLCATLQHLSEEFSGSSCPLRAGLAKFIDSTLYLMGQTANLGFFRSIPTLLCNVADEVAEMQLSLPESMLECDSFLLLLLTTVAAKSRVTGYDRASLAVTTMIANNTNLPAHTRGLALVIQADDVSYPYSDKELSSSNMPKETIIRRRAREISLSVDIQPSCPLGSLTSSLLDDSDKRLATIEGESRHSALKRIADVRTNAEADSLDSRQQIDDIVDNFCRTVGGSGCDQCGTSLLEANMPNFLKCGRCCQAHFCCEECHALAWDSWHGKRCRKVGTFSIGDIVCARGFDVDEESKDTRLGSILEITGKSADGGWEVTISTLDVSDDDTSDDDTSDDGTYKTDVIQSKNLYRLRSLY